ncbi:MAG: DEAD/DEAH box helicase [Rikenellaceae bacterium]
MAQKFGNTWWGEAWLCSLDNIDYSNRLPRGATLARNGSVKSINIKGNSIAATVQGSRRTPYRVNIIIPPFFEDDIKRLVSELLKHPIIISRLLNRQLDPSIMEIASNCGLKIFPRGWTDFKMQCSCPDWAVPCKHLAATIYMISREIDNNPFLAFEIHNVDLIKEIQKRGVVIEQKQALEVPEFSSLIVKRTAKEAKEITPISKRVNLSSLPDIAEPMISILPDKPTFCGDQNFKTKYSTSLISIIKKVRRSQKAGISAETLLGIQSDTKLSKAYSPTILVDYDGNYNMIGVQDLDDKRVYSINDLIELLLSINSDFLPDYSPNIFALHQSLYTAIALISRGAITPQIVRDSVKSYRIIWTPAHNSAEVRQTIEQLQELMPPKIIEGYLKGRKTPILVKNQAELLTSYFITKLINRLSRFGMDDFLNMFFYNSHQYFDGVGESEIAGGIKAWLDHYSISSGRYRTLFIVEEDLENDLFKMHLGVEDRTEAIPETYTLNSILTDQRHEKIRYEVLKAVSMLVPMIPSLSGYINSSAREDIQLSYEEFTPILMQVIPAVKLLDVKVILPKSLQHIIRPKASVKLEKRDNDNTSFIRLDDLLSFNWQIALGKEKISRAEFAKLTSKATGLLKFKGQFIYVDAEDIERLRKAMESGSRLGGAQLLQTALSEEYEGAPITLSEEVRDLIRELTKEESIELPAGVNAELRPYQLRGYSWMYRNMRIGFGSIIADDMGLGKTLQVITLIQRLKEDGALAKRKVLIITPTGLLYNWQKELERFAPNLTNHIYHGQSRKIADFDADIMLTSYGVLRSDADILKRRKWQVVVIDEAQNIKNAVTAQSKAVRSIPASAHIAMSGTPVENRLSEFWSIMEFTNKGYLGTVKSFNSEYSRPIQQNNDMDCVARFRKITAPFMLRRLKSDKSIIADLPDKIEENQYARLTSMQSAIYHETLSCAMNAIEDIDDSSQQALFKRQGLILQMILALKQICNHPSLFIKNGEFSAELSGKAQMLLDIVDTIVQSGEKVLIFTQFKQMGTILERIIEDRLSVRPLFYHGGCSIKEREAMVDRFQTNKNDQIFILSLKAAGTGLNLTAATHVIHYDLWWNPAVEAQATDRAYRIGQKSNVVVHRFITKDTFEERINDMIESKRHLANMTVSTGERWIGELSNSELREIFG